MPSSYRSVDTSVARVVDLTPNIRRVTFQGEELRQTHPLCLDRRIKIILPRHVGDRWEDLPRGDDWYEAWLGLGEARPPLRTYTARQVRPALGEVDVDVIRHGRAGPAGRWIESVEPGNPQVLVVPAIDGDGSEEVGIAWRPGAAREVLVAGDATAAPAVANILASLPPETTGFAFLELPTSEDDYPLQAPPGVEVHVLPCDGSAPGARLEQALASLAWPPDCPRLPCPPDTDGSAPPGPLWEEAPTDMSTRHYAWLAGEAGAITRIRRLLVSSRGCPRQCVSFMGYWRTGQAES